ncbi:hypothetical protein PAXRUDRAFT_825652 [Paxillus rubicundulus Ve08.2h10]|uniref:Uncharacterized protein n=1 Tax=Paxillus rubicundulus Ve08.2h10 TaxID=930991 RepID=A0A0D0EAM8_9AGAM|nr:hypothetical protein PAXRUDRAFT_825652 [Paxillus rubicundulus Ve08.2h10]
MLPEFGRTHRRKLYIPCTATPGENSTAWVTTSVLRDERMIRNLELFHVYGTLWYVQFWTRNRRNEAERNEKGSNSTHQLEVSCFNEVSNSGKRWVKLQEFYVNSHLHTTN